MVKKTTKRTTGMGFPQGGVCSATLWSLAFDEAGRLINTEDTLGVAIADDCPVLSGGTDPSLLISRVQRTVDRLVAWGSERGLTFNPVKTGCLFHPHPDYPSTSSPPVTLTPCPLQYHGPILGPHP